MAVPNRKTYPMFFRRSHANSISPASLVHTKMSELVERGWEDTVPAPFDPLRESDLQAGASNYETFALTMPMGLTAR
jgi:hypothetical protein